MDNGLNKATYTSVTDVSNLLSVKSKIVNIGTTTDINPKDLTLFSCLKNTGVLSKILGSTSSSTNKNVELMNKLIKNSQFNMN
jgi:hypothetical protein